MINSLSDLKPGDKATIYDHFYGPRKIAAVATVDKRYITLDDGTKWDVRYGRPPGCQKSTFYAGASLSPYKQGDAEKIHQRVMVARLGDVRWTDLDYAQLLPIYEAWKAATKKEGGG